jgi:hypothetical protein
MIKMQRRMLYTPVFHIDTNVINGRGKLASMNQIEKWAADEVILVNMSGVSFKEALIGNDDARTMKTLAQIFTLTDVNISENDPLYQKIENALFPGGAQTQNMKNDVKVVYEAAKYAATLITNDGGSKTQPGGILGNRTKLRDHLTIFSDNEAVESIRAKIKERDDFNRQVAEMLGEKLPEWTGKD